jgi:DNA-directed RNA polymerase subunit RPC12/RpoP
MTLKNWQQNLGIGELKMVSCKDCVHFAVCRKIAKSPAVFRGCALFTDRSQFVELKHAEWVEDEDMYGDPIYRCSACNERFVLEEGTPIENRYFYCPNCGAMMGDICPLPEEGDDE